MDRAALLRASCRHREQAASDTEITAALGVLADWMVENGKLVRIFRFRDYHQTLAFVNAVAFIAHAQDHHPELTVGYDRCVVRWNTHDVGGLSDTDFDCAERVDALLA